MVKLNIKKAMTKLEKEEEERTELSPHTILIVDDEEPNLRALAHTLSHRYSVTTHLSAKAALEEIDSGAEFSVVICDYRMPEMTGVEFFRALKTRQHAAPRIMVTGFAALDNVIAAINDCSVFQYITKPVDSAVLMNVVDEAVALREVRDENGRLMTIVKELLEFNAELAKNNAALGGSLHHEKSIDGTQPRKIDLCVLFADVRGFTQLVKEHDPEKVVIALQLLFKPMHEIVYKCGGIIDKHLGDGLMAIFGLSGVTTTAAALQAARQLVPATAAALGALPAPFNQLKVSYGLAGGEVVVGMLGSERKTELAVIGEPANLAARLQEFTKLLLQPEWADSELGTFEKVMCVYPPASFHVTPEHAEYFQLPDGARVRDFPELTDLGIVRA